MKKEIRKKSPIGLFSITLFLFAVGFMANGAYQLLKKPTEAISLVGLGSPKSPISTWSTYKDSFVAHSTPLVSAEFLASLAFVESSGNPLATPPWVLRLTTKWDQVFSPATSAAGLFQFTDGTFEIAQKQCDQSSRCPSSWFYSRLWPEHSIKLAAHYLDNAVERLLRRARIEPTKAEARQLASVIHLCGERKGQQLIRNNFSLARIQTCGSHSVRRYVKKIETLHRRFASFSAKNLH